MLKLLWVLVTAILVGFAFLLGFSFGLGSSHASFVNEVVPVLSMLGGWVSGIGALAAVITTLVLARKQRKEDVEHLQVALKMSLMTNGGPWFMNLQVASDGRRPSTVTGIAFTSPHAKHACHITGFMNGGSQLPVQLGYGEQANFMLDYGTEERLCDFVSRYCGGKASGLKVVVSTNLNSFSHPVDKNFLTLNS